MGWIFSWRSIPIKIFLCNGNLISFLTRLRKLFKGGNYSREETICGNTLLVFRGSISTHCVLTRPYHILKEHARIDDLGGNMITAHHTYVYPVARYVTCNLQPKIDKKHIFQFLQICSLLYLWFMMHHMSHTLSHKFDAFGTQGFLGKVSLHLSESLRICYVPSIFSLPLNS